MEQVFLTAGGVGAFLAALIILVRLAVGAHKDRADDWRTAAQTGAEANRVMAGNVDRLVTTTTSLVTSVEQLTTTQREMVTTQREMMTLLTSLVNERRGMT